MTQEIMTNQILVFGEINLDIYIKFEEPFVNETDSTYKSLTNIKTGGNTWNIAKILAMLGKKTIFLCTSRKDPTILYLIDNEGFIENLKIEWIDGINTKPPIFCAVDASNGPVLRAIDIKPQEPVKKKHRQTVEQIISATSELGGTYGVLASSIESGILENIIKSCHKNRIKLVGAVSSSPSAVAYLKYLSYLEILILNYEEAELLSLTKFNHHNVEVCLKEFSLYTKYIVLTNGDKGVIIFKEGKVWLEYPAYEIKENFKNSLGAGDAFTSFLISSLSGNSITTQNVDFATFGASYTCQIESHILNKNQIKNIKAKWKK